jgi:hypothetical protein
MPTNTPVPLTRYSSAVVSNSPLAYYRLDQSGGTVASDSSGNSATGTYAGTVTYGVSGTTGDGDTAVSLPGASTSYIASPNLTVGSAFTLEGWVNPANVVATGQIGEVLLSPSTSASSVFGYIPAVVGGALASKFIVRMGGATTFATTHTYASGQWYYVVYTWDGTTQSIYVNGVLDASGGATATSATPAWGGRTYIGVDVGSSTSPNPLQGSIDDVAVYSNALTASQVQSHFSAATPVTPTATNTPVPTATNTPVPTATSTPIPTATSTPRPTATNTPVPTATSTALPTATNTQIPTATATPRPTSTNTPVPTATNTPLPTATNTPVATATATPTATNTSVPTVTNTPLPTATNTSVPTATATPQSTATNTPAPTATNTPLPTATNTPVPTPTSTPLPTATSTPVPTATSTPLPTATNTPLPTATSTPLPTATNTPVPTATATPKPTATNTPLPTATNTPLPTATNTPVPTATATPKPTATNTPVPTATTPSIALGAFIPSWTVDSPAQLDNYTHLVGKAPAAVWFPQNWGDAAPASAFNAAELDAIRTRGEVPMVTWEASVGAPYQNVAQPSYSWSAIASGSQDAYLTAWATAAKNYGYPFYVRLFQEMNGNWFPWGYGVNGNNNYADFVRAWQHVVTLFRSVGATNVGFIWCPSIAAGTTGVSSMYPGDNYVDWIAMDGYNSSTSSWITFFNRFSPMYTVLTGLSATKPLMIPETASLEGGTSKQSKPQWITDGFLTNMQASFPRVRAVLWYDATGTQGQNYPVDSTAASLTAWQSVVSNSYYQGRLATPAGLTPEAPGACPSGWSCGDIGSPPYAGTQYLNNGSWQVIGSGTDIWGTSDQFHYVWQNLPGDGSISARVSNIVQTAFYAKAGVMIRQSSDPGAPYYGIFITPTQGVGVQYRSSQGAAAVSAGGITTAAVPLYVKVTVSGGTYSGYTSSDGVTWTLIPGSQVALSFTSPSMVGLAVTSHTLNAPTTGFFDNVNLSIGAVATDTPVPTAVGTPAPTATSTPVPTPTASGLAYNSVVLADTPVAYYRLDDPNGPYMTDYSGHNSTGAYNGAVTYGAAGATSDADAGVSLPGTTSAFASTPPLTFGGSFSLEAWVKPADIAVPGSGGVETLLGSSSNFYNMLAYGTPSFGGIYASEFIVTMGGSKAFYSLKKYPAGLWYHVVYTWDGTNQCLYVNGLLDTCGQAPATTSAPSWGGYTYIGGDPTRGASDPALQGSVDDVALYNYALSATQILTHFTSASTIVPAVTPLPTSTAVPSSAYASSVLSNAPLAYYRLDDSSSVWAADRSGNANTGIYTGTITQGVAGATGEGDTAISLPGTSTSYVGSAALSPGSAFTLEAWVNPANYVASGQSSEVVLATSANFNNVLAYVPQVAGGTLTNRFVVRMGGTANFVTTHAYASGQWYYVVYTWDGTTQSIYVNGVLDTSGSATATSAAPLWGGQTYVGVDAANSTNPGPLQGSVDDVAIYNGALTAAQIQSHYAAKSGATPVPTSTPVATATSTPVPTATSTPVATATNTPVPTATNTSVATATSTPVPTATSTPVPTATSTPLPTPVPSSTP